ncbi:MAG: CheR family methyltransferase [Bryobacteraceae bacterium]|jgi:chemotaxis protein methyltransferase CheR
MIRLQPEERKSLAEYVYSLCSIVLDESKAYLIEGRLATLVEESGAGTYGGLLRMAKAEPGRALERRIVDAITTNETSFFRDTTPFDLLRHKIIPELIDRRGRTGAARIRIWSAACSTGQELYSIAILLKELLGDPGRYGVQLLGTDISDDAVARASRGIFTPVEVSRGLSEAQKTRYYVPVDGGWQIRDEIRAMASFKKLNLMADFSGLGRFDVIFCRNVAIYFSERDKISLFGRMERSLESEGCLVIGAMESLNGICPQFDSKRHLRSVFYQAKARTSTESQLNKSV